MGNTRRIQAQNRLEHKGRVHGRIDRRVGAYEEQFQPFIWKPRQGHLLGLLPEDQESGLARCGYLLMTNKIDQGVTRRRQQPGLRILWHAVSRPGHECRYQRIAEGVLSAGHVARVRGKVCHQTAVGLAGHPLDRPVSALVAASAHPVIRRLVVGARGRTSTAPAEAAGQRAAQSSAASSEGSSRIVNPPSCSLVSAKGPSCTRRFPSLTRTVVAVSGTARGSPPTYMPASTRAL